MGYIGRGRANFSQIISGEHVGTVRCLITLLLCLVTPLNNLWATTFANRPLGSVVQEANLIVRGTTGSSASDWGKGEFKGSIYTYTDFEVTEVLKDTTGKLSEGKRIVLKQPGGEKDGVEMSVAATAVFQPGEDVVLTLSAPDPSDESYMVLNLTAGKYNVIEENGQTMIVNSLGGGEVYDPNRRLDVKVASYNSKIPLETMRALAKGEVREESYKSQFAPSNEPGPKRDNHDHGNHTPKNNVQNNQPTQDEQTTNSADNDSLETNESPLSWYFYGALLILGILGMFYGFSKRRRK